MSRSSSPPAETNRTGPTMSKTPMAAERCPSCHSGRLRVTPWMGVYQCDSCRVGTTGPRRISCLVPFCRSTRGDCKGDLLAEGLEWICARHWALVPRRLKLRRARLRRMERRATAARVDRIRAADQRIWRRCKVAAIEAAGGIG
jgi:hypothetical protein